MRISVFLRQRQSNSRRRRLSFSALFAIALLALPLVQSTIAQADEALTYDANGNVQTRTLPGGTTTYGYDALDRINNEAGPAKTQGITYDANGNRLSDGTGNKTYTANTDRIVTENGNTISLDAAGQVTQARGLNFVWNQVDGQIKTVSQGSTLLATYFYDYQGHRSRKVTTAAAPQGAGTVIYHYDLYNRLLAEFDGAGNPKLTYVWRDDEPVAIIVHGTTETALYLETDHLGTPIAARDQSAKVVWRWEPDAFGGALPNEDPDGDGKKVTINLRFPGQYYDKESGLHNNWHRYYDPKLGRYMSPDLIGRLGGPNLYAYVKGNPVSRIDPLGLADYSKIDLANIVGHLNWVFALNYPGEIFATSRNAGPERDMLARLKLGKEDPQDVAFYLHERAEAALCKPYRNVDPEVARRAQEDMHLKVLRDQGTTPRDLYHSSVVKSYPDLFNSSFLK